MEIYASMVDIWVCMYMFMLVHVYVMTNIHLILHVKIAKMHGFCAYET